MEGRRVTLFKSVSGGDALINRKATEKGAQGTRRGSSKHERTGKKKEVAPMPPKGWNPDEG